MELFGVSFDTTSMFRKECDDNTITMKAKSMCVYSHGDGMVEDVWSRM